MYLAPALTFSISVTNFLAQTPDGKRTIALLYKFSKGGKKTSA